MATRLKEDEKNERIIRGLIKLPENKRCINCNSLGPQYVCITFWTFVCTNCSGIHREFTHRVKSVSMAKFTSQEVSALQEGGNQHAREIYFQGFDLQHQPLPDGSNVERLRDFIRHVYVNKKYMSDAKPPRTQMGDKNDINESRSPNQSRSPAYEDASPGGRSPGFESGSVKFGDYIRSPSRPEIVNDWHREDRFTSGRKSNEGFQSPERLKDSGLSSPPVARPVREILGDSVVPLRVISGPPEPKGNRNIDATSHAKGNTRQAEVGTAVSLIDFDADPEPPAAPAAATQAQPSVTPQPVSSGDDNWASFDISPSVNATQAPANGTTVDSLLSQLMVPSTPVQKSEPPSGAGGSSFPANPLATDGSFGAVNSTGQVNKASTARPDEFFGGQWPNVGYSTPQIIMPPLNGPPSNQPWNTALASNVQRSQSAPSLQPTSGGLQPSQAKSSGRTELPVDLFAASYPSYHGAVPAWQVGPPHVGFGMHQYNTTMQFQNLQQPGRSMNPFDVGNESTPPQTQMATPFPSMSPLQGDLPNNALPPSNMMRTSSLGAMSQAWMPPPAHNLYGISSQTPAHLSVSPPSYMSPQMPPSNVGTSYGAQHGGSSISRPPSGGNPFG